MAKPNYSFEKRQRELAKKKKKEQKLARKASGKEEPSNEVATTQTIDTGSTVKPPGEGTGT